MTYSNLPRIMLLTVAILGLMSVASACEISGYKYQELGDGTKYVDHPLQGWNIYLFKDPLSPGTAPSASAPGFIAQRVTGADGKYYFDNSLNLGYRTYYVYEEVRPGWTQLTGGIYPASSFYTVTFSKSMTTEQRKISGLNFVNQYKQYVKCSGETSWAAQQNPGQTRFVQKGNWATYITYNVGEGTNAVPKVFPLYAGQTKLAGSLYVYDEGSNLYVKYVAGGSNAFKEYHLQVEDEFAGFNDVRTYNKKTGYGSPIPGQFEYVKEYSTKTADSGWITVPISGYGDKDVFIAAHAAMA